jgi:large subunit ribosomal protein L18
MTDKKVTRLRRARKARLKMHELEVVRLCVFRSSQHIYAQVISADGNKVLASASTLDKELRDGATGNIDAATKVGQLVATRAKAAGVSQWLSTALASSTMAASKRWLMLLVKLGWSSKLCQITTKSATKATSRSWFKLTA